MQTEEKLIAPFVEDLTVRGQYHIITALGAWFQSYETTIAFKGEFGVLINKDWWEGKRTKTTSKYLVKWLGEVERPFVSMKDVHIRLESGEYKLVPLTNYTQHPALNTQHPTVK